MTIDRFNEIRAAIRACKTPGAVDAIAKSVGHEVQAAMESPTAYGMEIIIRNLAATKREALRREVDA